MKETSRQDGETWMRARESSCILVKFRNSKAGTIIGGADVINLEDHLHHLSGQKDLLLLAVKSLNHVLLLHVRSSLAQAVNAQRRIVLGYLTGLNLRQCVDGRQARVLSQRQGNGLERVRKRPERVLLQRFDLITPRINPFNNTPSRR